LLGFKDNGTPAATRHPERSGGYRCIDREFVAFTMAETNSDLRLELRAIFDRARYDAAVFAIVTVVLTPFFAAVGVVVLLIAVSFVDLPVIDDLGYALSFVTGVNLTLAFMVASFFLRPKARYQRTDSDATWVAVALGLLGVLLLFSYGAPLVKTHPSHFWPIYVLLSLAVLGCIGHAYEPREDYYLGWSAGPVVMDDPFTVEDDIDRAHFSLGFAMALSSLIIESYSTIFGSVWLWRRLEERELSAAVKLLQTLAANDRAGARAHTQTLNAGSALAVVRALVKIKMIAIERGHLRLQLKGQEFLALKRKA
jgi:hypothetical protein